MTIHESRRLEVDCQKINLPGDQNSGNIFSTDSLFFRQFLFSVLGSRIIISFTVHTPVPVSRTNETSTAPVWPRPLIGQWLLSWPLIG